MKKLLFLLLAAILPAMAWAYDACIDGIYYNFNSDFEKPVTTTIYVQSDTPPFLYGWFVVNSIETKINGAWPGKQMYEIIKKTNKNGEEITFWCQTFSFEETSSFNIILNNGNTAMMQQTPNITNIASDRYFIYDGGYNYTDITEYFGVEIPEKAKRTATVTYGNSIQDSYSGIVNIPKTVDYNGNTYNVQYIGSNAFYNCSDLTSITIPNSVTSIGEYSFSGCSGLTSVTIPNSVTIIGYSAFSNCSGLTSVTIPNSVTSIESGTFSACCGLVFVTIPTSVTSIGEYAFSGCSGLISVTIPYSVTSIGSEAFYGCSGLTSVTIPNSVTSIGTLSFYGCSGLTSITIPNGVTSIGDSAFSGCSGLTSVTIPTSVTSIGNYAFYGCSDLTSVTIPNSVTSIGYDAFQACKKINSLYISDLSAWCCLFNSNSSSSIFSSNHHLFLNGIEIERLTIPNDITAIGNYAFYGCSYITSITVPNCVTAIGESAFEKCSKVEELKLPDNLQIIKKATFKGCNSLKSVTIPSTVEVIYQEAFAGNYNMESVKALPETPPFLYDNSFSNYNIPLYASKTAIGAYQTTTPWSKFAQFLTLDGQEVEMPQCATPTIDYANWKVTFSCETEGAEIVTKAVCSDTQEGDGGAISLMPTYTITAYAKAEGYRDSEVATATIGWKNGRPVIIRGFSNASLEEGEPICDVNNDGKVDVGDITTIIKTMAK